MWTTHGLCFEQLSGHHSQRSEWCPLKLSYAGTLQFLKRVWKDLPPSTKTSQSPPHSITAWDPLHWNLAFYSEIEVLWGKHSYGDCKLEFVIYTWPMCISLFLLRETFLIEEEGGSREELMNCMDRKLWPPHKSTKTKKWTWEVNVQRWRE